MYPIIFNREEFRVKNVVLMSMSVSLSDLALLLCLSKQRVQELTELGVLMQESPNHYNLVRTVQSYTYFFNEQIRKYKEYMGDFDEDEDLDQLLQWTSEDLHSMKQFVKKLEESVEAIKLPSVSESKEGITS
jgi:hypothetical protein